jgi:Ion channel
MALNAPASTAIDQNNLRNWAVEWKSPFFGSTWANYAQAKSGTFRLIPPSERLAALQSDYESMRDMYLSEPASFDDILAVTVRASLFDEFHEQKQQPVLSAPSRVVVLGLINYFELILCFAGIYASAPDLLRTENNSIEWCLEPIEKPVHFSFITQLTIGYGDLYPTGWLRPICWLQGFSGLGITALLIARYIAAVPREAPQNDTSNESSRPFGRRRVFRLLFASVLFEERLPPLLARRCCALPV